MGFRAPTLKEKYYNFDMSGIWIVEGNDKLNPEVSHNFNLSADYSKGHYNLTASAYYNIVVNKLATAAPYLFAGSHPVVLGKDIEAILLACVSYKVSVEKIVVHEVRTHRQDITP